MQGRVYYQSPFGWFEIKGSRNGITSVRLVDCPSDTIPNDGDILHECARQLDEYFNNEREVFELDIDWGNATAFNKSVWYELLKITYGTTSTYSAIAKKLNNPSAVRAVGLANRNNPIAIIVPCHRIIAKSGKLQGYFYGLEMKRRLLALENPKKFAYQGTLF